SGRLGSRRIHLLIDQLIGRFVYHLIDRLSGGLGDGGAVRSRYTDLMIWRRSRLNGLRFPLLALGLEPRMLSRSFRLRVFGIDRDLLAFGRIWGFGAFPCEWRYFGDATSRH